MNLGYGFSGRSKVEDYNTSIKKDGFIGGGFAGYNWQQDNFVYGVEGDLGYNGTKARKTASSRSRVSKARSAPASVTPSALTSCSMALPVVRAKA